ncbi:MAG: Swt1 family HEPN domain-containing protein [Planktothrix sp. GU0601_MAG3]|nr:MAG: Swt1 family HEPN domain-containing protein [Planktothrix sp. GU0601_MAG3]
MANKNQHSTEEQLLVQNHARIGQGLIYLAQGLLMFVKETLQRRCGNNWETVVKNCLADKQFHIQGDQVNIEDCQALLQIIIKERDGAFYNTLSRDNISLIFDLGDIRRKWAHPRLNDWIKLKYFTSQYTYRSLDKMLQVLEAIQAKDGIGEVKQLMAEVLPLLQEKPEYENQLQSRLIQEKTEGFVGREFVFDAIQTFLDHQPNGYFIIEGDPGIGKSAILAKYVEETGCVAHFNVRFSGS